ncbi:MAG: twin-arginine translocation signal domain-containing protein, partial [Deltaproteobacteria bacterium]|nr:twin-arginine translocation signal domain-containing protein [Deltaproteobacteria bacterium]
MKRKKVHPYVPELLNQFEKGRLTRREFLRFSGLLGVSAGAASSLVGFSKPKSLFAAKIRRGGVLKVAVPIQKLTHPAQISWMMLSNQVRHVLEYLTYTDHNNITHPYLLKNWEVSDDLKTWTLNLRQGITFHNGDEFTADDVVFTMTDFLRKEVGSSMLGYMNYLNPSNIEKTGKYQVILHLTRPEIAVPEHLFHYPAAILNHKTFEGDFLKNPHGTGPYTLEEFQTGERCVIKRRSDYWRKGADGLPLPYMDGMEFIDMGSEMSPQIAAIKSGTIDMIDLAATGGINVYHALKDDPNVNVQAVVTGGTRVLRMRVDLKPWNDNRVRMALKLCQHREKILALAYSGQGAIG